MVHGVKHTAPSQAVPPRIMPVPGYIKFAIEQDPSASFRFRQLVWYFRLWCRDSLDEIFHHFVTRLLACLIYFFQLGLGFLVRLVLCILVATFLLRTVRCCRLELESSSIPVLRTSCSLALSCFCTPRSRSVPLTLRPLPSSFGLVDVSKLGGDTQTGSCTFSCYEALATSNRHLLHRSPFCTIFCASFSACATIQ